MPENGLIIKLDLYERLWDLLEGVDPDPNLEMPVTASNREEEN
jgi:hypothetical protein